MSGESLLVKNAEEEVCILKVIQDINSQKTFENWLQNLNDFNERILATIDDIVIVVDSKMSIIKSNKAFSEMFTGRENDTYSDIKKLFDKHIHVLNKIESTINTGIGFIEKELEIETKGCLLYTSPSPRD